MHRFATGCSNWITFRTGVWVRAEKCARKDQIVLFYGEWFVEVADGLFFNVHAHSCQLTQITQKLLSYYASESSLPQLTSKNQAHFKIGLLTQKMGLIFETFRQLAPCSDYPLC